MEYPYRAYAFPRRGNKALDKQTKMFDVPKQEKVKCPENNCRSKVWPKNLVYHLANKHGVNTFSEAQEFYIKHKK